jgi:hypothetical protein
MIGSMITKAFIMAKENNLIIVLILRDHGRLVADSDNSKKLIAAKGKTGGRAAFAARRPPGNWNPRPAVNQAAG